MFLCLIFRRLNPISGIFHPLETIVVYQMQVYSTLVTGVILQSYIQIKVS